MAPSAWPVRAFWSVPLVITMPSDCGWRSVIRCCGDGGPAGGGVQCGLWPLATIGPLGQAWRAHGGGWSGMGGEGPFRHPLRRRFSLLDDLHWIAAYMHRFKLLAGANGIRFRAGSCDSGLSEGRPLIVSVSVFVFVSVWVWVYACILPLPGAPARTRCSRSASHPYVHPHRQYTPQRNPHACTVLAGPPVPPLECSECLGASL